MCTYTYISQTWWVTIIIHKRLICQHFIYTFNLSNNLTWNFLNFLKNTKAHSLLAQISDSGRYDTRYSSGAPSLSTTT